VSVGAARRLASPVRLTLASELGGDVDGAWWPHTANLARELPEVIDALHGRLGEIVDISINWSTTDGSPDLDSVQFSGALSVPGRRQGQQRLMVVTGGRGCAKVLVVPSRTTAALAMMVLRLAAALPVPESERTGRAFRSADCIVRCARAERASSNPGAELVASQKETAWPDGLQPAGPCGT